MPRYPQLDFIRGVAIAGILLLNIVSFALPSAAYLNPAWSGNISLPDTVSWVLTEIFARLKFLNLFALLFGAGLVFQIPKGGGWIQSRLGWLIAFGVLHALLLWEGDILVAWGLAGMLSWRLIRDARSAELLLRTGMLLYAFGCLMLLVFGLISNGTGGSDWLPGQSEIIYEQQIKLHGGMLAFDYRLDHLGSMLVSFFCQYGWELSGLMLVGAALVHNGWLIGKRSQADYFRDARRLLIPGLLLECAGALAQWLTGWSFRWSGFYLQLPGEIASPLVSLGYAALVLGGWKKISTTRLNTVFSAIGRLALSNYLLQTLVCTLIFSVGGLFMHFSRWQLLMIVPLIWLINGMFSVGWLHYFRQGPMERLWRWLTQKTA
ncbi:DUF418 domain-containing protein YeiB [Tatumella sp. UBA2305]|uniref:DUF418 domain-containing protein YeiB n=1 Tax=Tatumella sp. UBA2305 TaxID=1947647 RepID=UPI0025FF2DC6|nr:DUF418 domain-containing protein YeiB [Tatumella sp. UBA2305]